MSLSVYLHEDKRCPHCNEVLESDELLFNSNITHNLNKMATEAGIYFHLWRPDEIDITHARDLIDPLTEGLNKMKDDPEKYKEFNSPNGWGMYKHFIPWIEKYLNACIEHPDAKIVISR